LAKKFSFSCHLFCCREDLLKVVGENSNNNESLLLLEFSPAANEGLLLVVGENSNNKNPAGDTAGCWRELQQQQSCWGYYWLLERTPTTTRVLLLLQFPVLSVVEASPAATRIIF